MSEKINAWFVAPTQGQLDNVGVGCFVQVSQSNRCFWVEVDGEDGNRLTGVVHRELDTVICEKASVSETRVSFNRDQVVLLGCNRYCYC